MNGIKSASLVGRKMNHFHSNNSEASRFQAFNNFTDRFLPDAIRFYYG
jgi:hypothetical protein